MFSELELLYGQYQADPEFKHLTNNFVPGEGAKKMCKAVIIGEAPGATEDRLKRPFVGASGKYLRDRLADADLFPHECWITNVVKMRPPYNRTPLDHEIEASRRYLNWELSIIGLHRPPVLLVGATAAALLGFYGSVGSIRGEGIIRGNWRFLVTWHPAYVLRKGKKSQAAIDFSDDLMMLKSMINA